MEDGSREAKRVAAVVLEVLAGARSPADAAAALGVSAPRYYLLEQRAVGGLLAACEPRPRGPAQSPEKEVDLLRTEVRRLGQEVLRYQALGRATRRAVGLVSPLAAKSEAGASGARRRRKKPTVRALKAASRLQSAGEGIGAAAGEGAP